MIQRTFDPTMLNEVCNDPEVRPWLGGEGPIDVSASVRNVANFALVVDGGGFILINHGEGVYECHSQFLPHARRKSLAAMRDGMNYMFTRTDCTSLITQVPDNNPAAAALVRKANCRPMFRREDAARGPTAYVGISVDEWSQDTAELEADGHWFHDQIDAGKVRFGSTLPDHPDDPAHERAVGAAIRMIRRNNPIKGVAFYNRWAKFAGYDSIQILSLAPPVFDVGSGVIVGMEGDKMEILQCP